MSAPITRQSLEEASLDWILVSTFVCRLDAADQDRLLAEFEWRSFAAGEVVIPEGVPGPGLELIVEGSAMVRVHSVGGDKVLREQVGPGHPIGERSLFLGRDTGSEVIALSRMRTLHLAPRAFHEMIARSPAFRAVILQLVTLHERSAGIFDLLVRNPFFRLLGRADLELLMQAGTIEAIEPGHRIVRAGDRGSDVFVLLKGKVAVYAPLHEGGQRELLECAAPGTLFGHAAPLLEVKRTADIDAVEPSEVLAIPARAFMEILAQNPSVLRRLYRDLAAMDLRAEAAETASQRPLVTSINGLASGIGATTLAYGLAAEIGAGGSVVLVDLALPSSAGRLGMAIVDERVGEVAIGRLVAPRSWRFRVIFPRRAEDALALIAALRQSEGRRSHVLVVARAHERLPVGTQAACDQAIFLRHLSDGKQAEPARHGQFHIEAVRMPAVPVDGPVAASAPSVRIPADERTAGRFWSERDPELLRDEKRALGRSCRRLGRIVLGRAVGLALGGGGALGFAHIGLIQVMREAGIAIDYIAGSSFGAMVAGVYAGGGEEALAELIRRRHVLQWVINASMLTTSAIPPFVDRLLGRQLLSATEIPFLPVSMDLLSGREVVLSRGTIGQGVRSSSGLPGPFAAWRLGSWRLVDGGIINNVPASTTWEAGANFIIASNVIPSSPQAMMARREGGLIARAPSLVLSRMDDLLRSMYWLMSQAGRDRAYLSDYLFNLNVHGFGVHDMTCGEAIAEAGRRQAERELPAILHAWRSDGSARVTRPGG